MKLEEIHEILDELKSDFEVEQPIKSHFNQMSIKLEILLDMVWEYQEECYPSEEKPIELIDGLTPEQRLLNAIFGKDNENE